MGNVLKTWDAQADVHPASLKWDRFAFGQHLSTTSMLTLISVISSHPVSCCYPVDQVHLYVIDGRRLRFASLLGNVLFPIS